MNVMPTRNVMVGIPTFKKEVVKSKMQSTTNLCIAFFAKIKLQAMDKKKDHDCEFSHGLQTLKVCLTSNKIVNFFRTERYLRVKTLLNRRKIFKKLLYGGSTSPTFYNWL